MVPLAHLWIPIVLSAVAVFVVSSLIHMLLKYHNSDFKRLTNEDDVRSALAKGGAGPGQYLLPYCSGPQDFKNPAIAQKLTEGPVGMVILRPPGMPQMGKFLGQWFVYSLAISAVAAYAACLTIAPGATTMAVFRVVSTVAFLGYAGSHAQEAIWKGEPWSAAAKDIVDGLLYGLATGAIFALLWPAS